MLKLVDVIFWVSHDFWGKKRPKAGDKPFLVSFGIAYDQNFGYKRHKLIPSKNKGANRAYNLIAYSKRGL